MTEFGGTHYAHDEGWGYGASCYTQITDVEQETNGLLTADREPKVPAEEIRRIVEGSRPV